MNVRSSFRNIMKMLPNDVYYSVIHNIVYSDANKTFSKTKTTCLKPRPYIKVEMWHMLNESLQKQTQITHLAILYTHNVLLYHFL